MFKNKLERLRESLGENGVVTLDVIKRYTNSKNTSKNLLDSNMFFLLKKGLYATSKKINYYYVANKLLEPSYISLETALSMYSIIPDAVKSFSSITTKNKASYSNELGYFYYKSVKKELLSFGYVFFKNSKIAEPEKAILDYFYLGATSIKLSQSDFKAINKNNFNTKGSKKILSWLESERIENLSQIDFDKIKKYSKIYNIKCYYFSLILEHYYNIGEKQYITL